jgi:3'-phosphoadenosine 5'-phosphosulfate sulfotransferase (PAPS reductase)/FAD synthetase
MNVPFDPTNYDRVYCSFSGGKDSVASYIKVREVFPSEKIVLVFTDTGHEMPETYEYLKWFHTNVFPVTRLATFLCSVSDRGRRRLGNVLLDWDVQVSEFKEMGIITIFDEIRYRANSSPDSPPWPTNGIRYCTTALKINPFHKMIRGEVEKIGRSRLLLVRGLRREESRNRSNTPELVLDEVNRDFYWFWHPVYNLTTEQVFDLHREKGIKINPVYDIRERSNCVGCPFANNKEIAKTLKVYPMIMDEYVAIEKETGYTWKNGLSIESLVEASKNGNDPEEVPDLEPVVSCTSGYCDI